MVRHDLPQNSTSVASLPLVVFVGLTSLPIINQFVIVAEDAKTFGSCFRIDDRKYTTANSLCLIEIDALPPITRSRTTGIPSVACQAYCYRD